MDIAMNNRRIQDQGLVFDLSAVASGDFLIRLTWALQLGLDIARTRRTLGKLVSDLRAGKCSMVLFFDAMSKFGPGLLEVGAPAAASWRDGNTGRIADFTGPPTWRTDLRVFVNPTVYTQSVIEYCWHELLHLAVPFTHGQTNIAGTMPERFVNNDIWYPVMARIGAEFPRRVVDPVTRQSVVIYQPFSNLRCGTCLPVG